MSGATSRSAYNLHLCVCMRFEMVPLNFVQLTFTLVLYAMYICLCGIQIHNYIYLIQYV